MKLSSLLFFLLGFVYSDLYAIQPTKLCSEEVFSVELEESHSLSQAVVDKAMELLESSACVNRSSLQTKQISLAEFPTKEYESKTKEFVARVLANYILERALDIQAMFELPFIQIENTNSQSTIFKSYLGENKKQVLYSSKGIIHSLSLSPGARYLFFVELKASDLKSFERVQVLDLSTGKKLGAIKLFGRANSSLAIAPNCEKMAISKNITSINNIGTNTEEADLFEYDFYESSWRSLWSKPGIDTEPVYDTYSNLYFITSNYQGNRSSANVHRKTNWRTPPSPLLKSPPSQHKYFPRINTSGDQMLVTESYAGHMTLQLFDIDERRYIPWARHLAKVFSNPQAVQWLNRSNFQVLTHPKNSDAKFNIFNTESRSWSHFSSFENSRHLVRQLKTGEECELSSFPIELNQ